MFTYGILQLLTFVAQKFCHTLTIIMTNQKLGEVLDNKGIGYNKQYE